MPKPRPGATRMRLGRTIRPYAEGGLLVTPAMNEWLAGSAGNGYLSTEVADLIARLLAEAPRRRSGSFSASARGSCPRAQAFGFLGAPQRALTPAQYNLFLDGRWRHLRWQSILLMTGTLDEIEIPVPMPAWMAKGSVDGGNRTQGFGFELKGTRISLPVLRSAFQIIEDAVDNERKPILGRNTHHIKTMWKHYLQIHAYFHQLDAHGRHWDRFALVYEDKTTQEWAEFVIRRKPWVENLASTELADLGRTMRVRKLPQILAECRPDPDPYCPYADICHHPYDHLPAEWSQPLGVRLVAKPKADPAPGPTQTGHKKPPLRKPGRRHAQPPPAPRRA